jgi:hypothetical protein
MPRHELTQADRSKAGHARAAAIRQRREEAEQRAAAVLDAALERAVGVFVEAMEAYGKQGADHAVRIKAAAQVADRVLGRATQRTEVSGSVDLHVQHRERVASLLADHAERARSNGHS